MRVFHGWDRDTMALCFKVSTRTVFRWERDGLDPDSLALDPNAHPNSGPDWRRKLLNFLLERFDSTAVTDSRKKEDGTPHEHPPGAPGPSVSAGNASPRATDGAERAD